MDCIRYGWVGGVIHSGGVGDVHFYGTALFEGNRRDYTGLTTALSGGTPYRRNGGTFYSLGGTTTFQDTVQFISNKSTVFSTDVTNGTGVNRFIDTTASEGAVVMNIVGGHLDFKGSVLFDSNHVSASGANVNGAALRTTEGVFDFAGDAVFTNNIAQIYVRGEDTTGTLTRAQNIAAINAARAIGDTIGGTNPGQNGDEQRLSYGSAISAYASNRTTAEANFTFHGGVLFQGNKTLQYVVGNNGAGIDIGSDGNTASRGGAVHLQAGEMDFLAGTNGTESDDKFIFADNMATGRGGFAYIRDAVFAINCTEATSGHAPTAFAREFQFRNNQAVFGGGALYAYQGYILLEGEGIFNGNRAGQRGGAIFLQDDTNNATDQSHLFLRATTGDIVFTNNKGGVKDIYEYDADGNKIDTWNITDQMLVVIDPTAVGATGTIDAGSYYIDPKTNEKVLVMYDTGFTKSDFANDIVGNGATLQLAAYKGNLYDDAYNVVGPPVDNTIWFDGGIWQHQLTAAGVSHGGDIDKFGLGTTAFVGDNVWSYAVGTTSVVQGNFLLGANALWGKSARGSTVTAYNADNSILTNNYLLTGSDRNDALMGSSSGIGVFQTIGNGVAFDVNHGVGTAQWIEGNDVVLMYEMNNTSNLTSGYKNGYGNGSGYNAAIFCNNAIIADTTQFQFISGTGGLMTVNNQGYRDSLYTDSCWKVGYFYDLIHTNPASTNTVHTPMAITLGLDRGAFKNDAGVAGRESVKFREFIYAGTDNPGQHVNLLNNFNVKDIAPPTRWAVDDNVYALTLYRDLEAFNPFEPNAPAYDPSVRNNTISNRMARYCYPTIVRTPCSRSCGSVCSPDCTEDYGFQYQSLKSKKDRWESWAEGYDSIGRFSAHKGYSGFDFNGEGVLIGIDRVRKSGNRVGIFYGYGTSHADATRSSVAGAEHSLGAYTFTQNRHGHTLVVANIGYIHYDSHRTIVGSTYATDHLKGKFPGFTHGVYLEKGFFDKQIGERTNLTPFGALQYSSMVTDWHDEEAVTESWDIAQTMQYKFMSLRSLLGVRLNTMLTKRLFWRNSFHWEHELLDGERMTASVRLSKVPTDTPDYYRQTHKVGAYDTGRDWFDYGTYLYWSASKNLTLNVGYDLRLNERSVLHTGMTGVTYVW